MNISLPLSLLATHKECTGYGEFLYRQVGDTVQKWNGASWVDLDIRCSAQDFLKNMQKVTEKNQYSSRTYYPTAIYDNPIYPRKNVVGAYQGD
ncbi:hypothetical protein [Acinetobacter sp. 251-1]|uniref:hypothetical protein n=1 Tax=Acinetobacter sp. 251-1 TaxID=2746720 RepID=UPI0025787F3F|nr:hypothetical protein [Acinetobacter sp. 251-1]MDM1760051.1 hypothetical protein [Acinetobacter sp. 251-1]